MAKICKKCGVKYKNSAVKCIMCGTEFEDVYTDPKTKRVLLIGGIAVFLAAAAVVLAIFLSGPRAAVWRVMDCYKHNDADGVLACIPDFLTESDYLDGEAFAISMKANVRELSDYMVSYNIEKIQNPTSQYREELMDDILFFADAGFKESDITDVKIVWVNYKGTVEGYMGSNASRFTLIKYEGKWYWWPDNVNR